jgi:hypothetical protein
MLWFWRIALSGRIDWVLKRWLRLRRLARNISASLIWTDMSDASNPIAEKINNSNLAGEISL